MLHARLTRIPFGLAAILALTGMDGGCTQSELPLSSRDDGFADHYLVGTWHELEISEDGVFNSARLIYRVEFGDSGNLRITSYGDDAALGVYSGYSTRLGADKYLNARQTECPGCDDEESAMLAVDDCPFNILRYQTYLPDRIAREAANDSEEFRNTLVANANGLRGRLLFVDVMDDMVVDDAITAGKISGEANCEHCVGEGACIRAEQAALRGFVELGRDELYDNLLMLIRE
jgi:hypothetical protein